MSKKLKHYLSIENLSVEVMAFICALLSAFIGFSAFSAFYLYVG